MPIRREAAKFFYTLFYTFRRKTKNRVLHHFFPLFLTAQLEHFQFYTTFSRFFWPRNWKNRVLHHFFPFFFGRATGTFSVFSFKTTGKFTKNHHFPDFLANFAAERQRIFPPYFFRYFCMKNRKILYCSTFFFGGKFYFSTTKKIL